MAYKRPMSIDRSTVTHYNGGYHVIKHHRSNIYVNVVTVITGRTALTSVTTSDILWLSEESDNKLI